MRNLGTLAGLGAAPSAYAQLVPDPANPKPSGPSRNFRGQFLEHPRGFPLSCRSLPRWRSPARPATRRDDIGLSFHSPRAVPVGTLLELEIPLRQGPQRFIGPVVCIRELADGFAIDVELSLADAERAAIVERICELETRLRADDGATAHRRAREWAALRPRLERIPSLRQLLSAARRQGGLAQRA